MFNVLVSWVCVGITGNEKTELCAVTPDFIQINDNGMSHPFHLHGNTFWVLGVSTNRDGFDELNTVNPVARDTVNVPSDGMVKIRIHFDNRKFSFYMLVIYKVTFLPIANNFLLYFSWPVVLSLPH